MLILRFPEGKRKALTLSYDDGVEQDIRLIELLNRYGLKCTFNLNSGCFPPEGHVWPQGQIHRRMPLSACRELYGRDGHEVAVHTLTHPDLTSLPRTAILHEVYEDRKNLEEIFGGIVRGAAYPYGTYNDTVVEALRQCDIAYCRMVQSSYDFHLPQDWLRLRPTCHHADPRLDELCDRFLKDDAGWRSTLFYLWGHAYEFEAMDNWNVIERFAEKMSGQENIWYANNLQICDYVNAWRSLRVSVDGRSVENPSGIPLWMEYKRSLLCLQPGEQAAL